MMIPIVLFAIAALGGAFLAALRFQKKELPFPVAILHGLLAASGLVALLLAVVNGTATGSAKIALGLFVVAALGGFFLFSLHLRKRELPIPVVLVHAVVAVVAFAILVIGVLGMG
ncbi:MAG: hypothetical protein ABI461_14685 [Polyangiaceae bacterium]